MNSSLEKIFKMPTRQKIAVWVIVLVAIALGFYFLLIKSKQTELKDLQTKLNDLQTQIQENRKIADNLPVLQKEYNQLSMQLDRALTELPNQKEIPTLLTSITSAGKGAGLDFLVFKPQSEEPKEFYANVPVDISVSGAYQEVARFFIAVSELPRIVNISNVVFSDLRGAGESTKMKVTCLATTFRFLDKKEAKDEKEGK
jgi:type IV pilus assembly protein PilO